MKEIVDTATIIGAVCAGLFFLWKTFTGWLIINLAISINTTRKKVESENVDILSIETILEKGNIDTLYLKDISMKITFSGKTKILSFPELKRCKNVFYVKRIDWNEDNSLEPLVTLSPNERIQFAKFLEVPLGVPVFIELAIIGRRPFWGSFYWKSSAVSI